MLVPWRGIFATCSFLNMLKCTRVDVVVVSKTTVDRVGGMPLDVPGDWS